jgi:hypothetical protein
MSAIRSFLHETAGQETVKVTFLYLISFGLPTSQKRGSDGIVTDVALVRLAARRRGDRMKLPLPARNRHAVAIAGCLLLGDEET